MTSAIGRALGALLLASPVCIVPACGGGGKAQALTFQLQSVDPAVSTDLNGGDRVTIHGSNFAQFLGFTITFGGQHATNPVRVGDTMIEVTTPGAASAGAVTIEVTAVDIDGRQYIKQLVAAYTYLDPLPPPNVQAIDRTTFTPTGAEQFVITGSNLGPGSGTVHVTFATIGTVSATVSPDSTSVTGFAPVVPLVGPRSGIGMTLDTGSDSVAIPGQASYAYMAPVAVSARFQASGGASRPVRVADGFAVFCTAGGNNTWFDADDSVYLLSIQAGTPVATPITRPGGGLQVGYLDPLNSVPVVLDADTVCVYSVGPNGVADPAGGPVDDRVVRITAVRSGTPTVSDAVAPQPMNPAPLAGIGPNLVAFTTAGQDGILGNADDELIVYQFTGPATFNALARLSVGPVDLTSGPANASIPFSPDADSVFVVGVGGDGAPWTADDVLYRYVVSTNLSVGPVGLPNLAARPLALSGSLVAAVGLGANALPGGNDDQLHVVTPNGAALQIASHTLTLNLDAGSPTPLARAGSGVLIPTVGADGAPSSGDESLLVFTDIVNGTNVPVPFAGTAILATTGATDLIAFGPGVDLVPANGADAVTRIEASLAALRSFNSVPTWPNVAVPRTDAERAFATNDPDTIPNSGDETLVVYQVKVAGATTDAVTLPLGLTSPVPGAGVLAHAVFVPIGPDWGAVQCPGADGTFGGTDDQILVAHY